MGKTLINLHQNLPMSFVHCHHLVNNKTKESRFLTSLVLMPNSIPTWRGGGIFFVSPFVGKDFLRLS
jgi:hypothetical protein